MTRNELLEALRTAGYVGPTSYTKTKLEQIHRNWVESGDPVEELEAGHVLTWQGEEWAVTTTPEVDDQVVTFWAGRLADVLDPETGAWHDDPLVDKFSFPRGTKLHFS